MNASPDRSLIVWLAGVCAMVYVMVLVGGITRLTDSGLSMVEWRPIMGALPPMSAEEWNRVFQLYRQSPEYQYVNAGMSLADFKFIFFWEWFHRAIGRLVGVVYFFPLLYFQLKGRLQAIPGLSLKLWAGLILGGSQGVLGWYMVQSGLVDRVDVSHYRLAAHLSLALIIFCYLFWIMLGLVRGKSNKAATPMYKYSLIFLGILSLQIVWGAFTAGLKAGYGHNTFPDMSGSFFPVNGLLLQPAWLNFFETHAAVQFTHRTLGWILLLTGLFLLAKTYKTAQLKPFRGPTLLLFSLLCLQFLLGVGVIVLQVPVELAVLHQSGAFFLLLSAVALTHMHKFPNH